MLLLAIPVLLGYLLTAEGRDNGKSLKSIPAITGSLVNLGKMDISFHFNSKDTPSKPISAAPFPSGLFTKLEPEEPCPCSSLRGVTDDFTNPSGILNKILTSNDFFSFNKDPVSSTLCCDSHEHLQEDVVTFEIGPKSPITLNPLQNIPKLPFIFENFNKPQATPLSLMARKPSAIEIFLFPKKKDIISFNPVKKDFPKKDSIQIVGDKELRNDFKTLKFRPSIQLNQSFQSSVKKDLTAQEKNQTKKQTEKVETEASTAANPNALK